MPCGIGREHGAWFGTEGTRGRKLLSFASLAANVLCVGKLRWKRLPDFCRTPPDFGGLRDISVARGLRKAVYSALEDKACRKQSTQDLGDTFRPGRMSCRSSAVGYLELGGDEHDESSFRKRDKGTFS